jgi:hypothetical protein
MAEKEKARKMCSLCREREGESRIGAPVPRICVECSKIIYNWDEAKESQKRFWKFINDCDLSQIRDFVKSKTKFDASLQELLLDVLERTEEIELQCAELIRVIEGSANQSGRLGKKKRCGK